MNAVHDSVRPCLLAACSQGSPREQAGGLLREALVANP